jgi:hypothetical protein
MRPPILLVAIVAVAAAVTVAWSMSASKTKPTEASAPISPHDITVKQGNILPTEYWSHPY